MTTMSGTVHCPECRKAHKIRVAKHEPSLARANNFSGICERCGVGFKARLKFRADKDMATP